MDEKTGKPRVREFRRLAQELREGRPAIEQAILQETIEHLAVTLHVQLGKLKKEERAAVLRHILATIEPDHKELKDMPLAPWYTKKVGHPPEVQPPWINRHPLVFGAGTAALASAGTAVAILFALRC
jgi:hypothetical protein